MCAYAEPAFGPELALLPQRTPASRRDAIALSVLREELEGASPEWTVSQELARPVDRADSARAARPRWGRLLSRRAYAPDPCVARSPT